MLNYIWFSLILIGVGVALWTDTRDMSANKYRNGSKAHVTISLNDGADGPVRAGQRYECTITISRESYQAAYGMSIVKDVTRKGELIASGEFGGALRFSIDEASPTLWKEIAKAQKNPSELQGKVEFQSVDGRLIQGELRFDPVRFPMMNMVTNDGIIKYAKVAVELAIGLVGIMALWLGLMKIAEQAGLVARLALILRPLTTRIFPDVPADHPAMGAMIMNISANMLGVANAATPLGLKAMEELNKLSKKAGTATDAMCTFLVINTSSVQLIPATVIALRSAAGSNNPTEILGPVILATTVNTIVGVITVKALARMTVFRKQVA